MFPDTRGSITARVHSVVTCLLLISSHFRLSIKRSMKFFYLAPVCSVHTGLGSVLCSMTPVKEPVAFFSSLTVRAPLWGKNTTVPSNPFSPLHCLLVLASAQVTPKKRKIPCPFTWEEHPCFSWLAPKSHLTSSSSLIASSTSS